MPPGFFLDFAGGRWRFKMTNLEWLHQMKSEDERYNKSETTIRKFTDEQRITKALEIIAEELCKLNAREDNKYNNEYCEQSHDHTG